jgi:pimeloyl-ACP methyl ester carboxylesterase
MKKSLAVMLVAFSFSLAAFGQAELEKYVGQYQLTGVPLVLTVTAESGKLWAQATGQQKLELETVSADNYAVKGLPIKISFQKDASGNVTGLTVNQAGTDISAPKINASSEAPSDKSPHKSAFVTANGIRMNYLDWGGTGDVVILLSGFGNDAHIFDEIAPSFTDKFHVIGLTRRGFGETERPSGGYENASRVEDIRAFMDAQKISRAHLVGHSLAGDEMTHFASIYPERVAKLVYLDAAYDRTKMLTCADELPPEIAPAAAIRMMREAMDCPGWADIVVKDMPPADIYNVQISTMRSATKYRPEYKKVKAPSLSIYADPEVAQLPANLSDETRKRLDTYWKEKRAPLSRASIDQFRKEMKNGEIVEIKGSNHYLFVGPYKDQVIKLTKDFLAK